MKLEVDVAECAARVLGDAAAVNSFHDGGYWDANASNGYHCIGVYGLETEAEALKALWYVLRLRIANAVQP